MIERLSASQVQAPAPCGTGTVATVATVATVNAVTATRAIPATPGRMMKTLASRLHQFAWLGPAVLALAGVLLSIVMAIDHLAERHLERDAERSAFAWADHIARNVPDIDLVFLGDIPSTRAQDQLTSMRGMAGLFRFKLFAPSGRLVLLSDSIGTAPAPQAAGHAPPPEVLAGGHRLALVRSDGKQQPAIYSDAYAPVLHGQKMIGVVEVYVDQTAVAAVTANSFRQAALIASAALGAVFALGAWLWRRRVALERVAEERLRYLARHDPLTGALNRASFGDALAHTCQELRLGGPGMAVLHIDIDRFKEINDSHGHAAGDQLLRQAAERLRAVLRGCDLLARLGGDQFAVLQNGVADSQDVSVLAQRIVDALAQPHTLPGGPLAVTVAVTASVGAALHGVDGERPEVLTHHAELALLRAKTNGRASYSFYDAALDRALQDRRELAHDLRRALAYASLRLHYQPVFGSDGRVLLGYEALARWPHPLRGFVPPAAFIPVAEETGLIEELGRWVLDTACREAASWPAALSVAVNLSPAQFRRAGAIEEEVRAALAASGLAPQRLELEITESLLMGHTEQVLRSLHALHSLGVRIAMDDFGTGYSSLAYLWRFPFDKLKIDRAFTQGLGGDGKVDLIVHSIVSLAHSLSIRVNAEGVETESQCQALRRHGCDELQGFLLGRPQPRERLAHTQPAPGAADSAFGTQRHAPGPGGQRLEVCAGQ